MSEKVTTESERSTSIALLIFLIFLIAGSFIIAAIPLRSLLVWFVGMSVGFLFGVLAVVEFQMDQEKRQRINNRVE